MSRAVTHPFKPKIEPKEEMDVDDENDREDQKENIDLDVKANNVGGGLPGAFPALPAPLPGFAAAPAAGGFRADPLFSNLVFSPDLLPPFKQQVMFPLSTITPNCRLSELVKLR